MMTGQGKTKPNYQVDLKHFQKVAMELKINYLTAISTNW